MRWLITVVVIAIIAFVGYRYFYTDEGQQVAEQVEDTAEQAATQVEETAEEAAQAVEETAEEATEADEGATDEAADTAEQATESTEQAADEAADSAEQMTESAQESMAALTVGGVNLGEEIGTTVSDATSALEGITDKASAEAALPSLQAVETKLDELSGDVEKLPQHAKEALASLLDDSLPELQDLVSKVEGIEGVGEVVKPTLDGIMAKLDAWAQQPA
jgi:predicted negative regulator of RcsB-dependent stress response